MEALLPTGLSPARTSAAGTGKQVLAATHLSSHNFSNADAVMVGAVIVLIALSGIFALSETAMTRMSRVKAVYMVEEHKRGATSLLK